MFGVVEEEEDSTETILRFQRDQTTRMKEEKANFREMKNSSMEYLLWYHNKNSKPNERKTGESWTLTERDLENKEKKIKCLLSFY